MFVFSLIVPFLFSFQQCRESETVCAIGVHRNLVDRVCDSHENCARTAGRMDCKLADSACSWSIPRQTVLSHPLVQALPGHSPTSQVVETLNRIARSSPRPFSDGVCDDGKRAHMSLVYEHRAQTYDRVLIKTSPTCRLDGALHSLDISKIEKSECHAVIVQACATGCDCADCGRSGCEDNKRYDEYESGEYESGEYESGASTKAASTRGRRVRKRCDF